MSEPFAAVVIVAGGSGTRMGRPKQMLPVCGKPVLAHTVDIFRKCPSVGKIIVVTPEENRAELVRWTGPLHFVQPGNTRLASVQNGCSEVDDSWKVIAVHDGARPLASAQAIESGIKTALENGAAVLAVPVKDTLAFSPAYTPPP